MIRKCVTGHRPEKLFADRNYAYSAAGYNDLVEFAITVLREQEFDVLRIGMALGWDMACAHACSELKRDWIACVPFKGQESMWNNAYQKQYWDLLKLSSGPVEYVCEPRYAAWKMNKRNLHMVMKSPEGVIALWDGTSGGTGNCVKDAALNGRSILNVWSKWISGRKNI